MFGGDGDTLRSNGSGNQMYVVLQVVLTEKLWGTGSGASSLTNLENAARGGSPAAWMRRRNMSAYRKLEILVDRMCTNIGDFGR